MRILFALDKYTTRDGGADRLARGAVRALLDCGHDVFVLESTTREKISERTDFGACVRAVPLPHAWLRDTDWQTLAWNAAWQPVVTEAIGSFRPDLVLTQNILAPATIAAARAMRVKSAILFHGHRCMSPTFFYHDDALTAAPCSFWNVPWRMRFKWPLVQKTMALYRQAYLQTDILIANSTYAAKALERFFGRACPVLFPLLDMHYEPLPETAPAPHMDATRILFVKPQRNKGVDVLAAVAKQLPERTFFVVGKASRRVQARFASMPNVTLAGWVDDMEAVFAQTRFLFGPSQNPEPFGKVFVEAGIRGIPVLGSMPGGSEESIGAGGVRLPIQSPAEAWARSVEGFFADADGYAALSRAAYDNAHSLITQTTPQAFGQLIS